MIKQRGDVVMDETVPAPRTVPSGRICGYAPELDPAILIFVLPQARDIDDVASCRFCVGSHPASGAMHVRHGRPWYFPCIPVHVVRNCGSE